MPSFFTELVGSKPTVPDLPSLNLGTEQQKALAANQAAIPGAEAIASNVDLFNQQQIDRMLSSVIPNYKAITGNVSRNIASLTAGQIPTDVQQAVQSSAAAQSLSGGFGGTQAGGNLLARDLGLTSLNLTQQGLNSAESWIKTASSIYEPGNFNVASMFITPGQQASFDVEERNTQFQTQWMKNQIAAMPAPWASDLKQFVYRALSAYSGTSVPNNPYSTPGSFGSPNLGSGNFGSGFDSTSNFSDNPEPSEGGGINYGGEAPPPDDSGGGGGGLGGLASLL